MVQQVDPSAVLRALGMADPAVAIPVRGGSDTTIWRVEHGGGTFALRLFRAEQVETCRREVLAMETAARGGIPVPAIHAQGTWHDRPVLLLAWSSGRPLLQELSQRPWRCWPLGVAFGRMHAAIHEVPAPPPFAEHAEGWIAWAGPLDEALRSRLLAATDPPVLLHLDYHPLNVMTDGFGMTSVLDWANARAGDRRADVARTGSLLRLAPAGSGTPAPVMAVLRRCLEVAWRRGYESVAGPLGNMAPYYAWAGHVLLRDVAPKVAPRYRPAMERWTSRWTRHR